jgi:hypothetical protein
LRESLSKATFQNNVAVVWICALSPKLIYCDVGAMQDCIIQLLQPGQSSVFNYGF